MVRIIPKTKLEELEDERYKIQLIIGNYERGFTHFEQGPNGYLDRDATEERKASLRRQLAAINEKIRVIKDI